MNFRQRLIRCWLPMYAQLLLLAPAATQSDSTVRHFDSGLYYFGVNYYSDGTTSGGGPSGTFDHYTRIVSAGLAVNIPF